MIKIQTILAVMLILSLTAFSAGCTGDETSQEAIETVTVTPEKTDITTDQYSAEHSIGESLPSDIGVGLSASPVDGDTLLITYELDLSSMGTAMGHEGWDVIVTAYAYNIDDVEPGFSAASYSDLITAGIPYKSRNIRIYPGNVYPDKLEVSVNADTKNTIDTNRPYNYGIVISEK